MIFQIQIATDVLRYQVKIGFQTRQHIAKLPPVRLGARSTAAGSAAAARLSALPNR